MGRTIQSILLPALILGLGAPAAAVAPVQNHVNPAITTFHPPPPPRNDILTHYVGPIGNGSTTAGTNPDPNRTGDGVPAVPDAPGTNDQPPGPTGIIPDGGGTNHSTEVNRSDPGRGPGNAAEPDNGANPINNISGGHQDPNAGWSWLAWPLVGLGGLLVLGWAAREVRERWRRGATPVVTAKFDPAGPVVPDAGIALAGPEVRLDAALEPGGARFSSGEPAIIGEEKADG